MGGLSTRDKARVPVFKPSRLREWWELAGDGYRAPPEIKTSARTELERKLLERAQRAYDQGNIKLAKKLVARVTS